MKWIVKIFKFYINSSIHVSLAVVALQLITYLTLDISQDKNLLLFTFFATITGYNFIKYSQLAKLHHLSLTESLKIIQIFSLGCFCAMLYFLNTLNGYVLLACFVLGFITVLYALPVFSRKRTLRSLLGVKIYAIAVVWAGVVVTLPVLQATHEVGWDEMIMSIQRFLFVVAITLPFDIRDLGYDDVSIGTLPAQLGVKKTKMLGVLILVFFVLLEGLKDKITIEIALSTIVIAMFCVILLLYSTEKQSKYYASFWVESMPFLWFVLVKGISIY